VGLLYLAICISGFPAFAENDGKKGRITVAAYLQPSLTHPALKSQPSLTHPALKSQPSLTHPALKDVF